MSPRRLQAGERAKPEPAGQCHSLAHRIDVPALERAYRRQRAEAAVGVDGSIKEHYGQDVEANLQDLHARLKAQRLGRLCGAVGRACPWGYATAQRWWSRHWGPPRGRCVPRCWGNVYWHDVLDRWFETEGQPRLRGKAPLSRFWDDFLIGCEREDDARRGMAVLGKRWARFGLTLHPDKTRRLPFGRPPQTQQSGKGPATLDFLGCTFYGTRPRKGHGRMWGQARRASLRRAKQASYDGCRRHRHRSSEEQPAALWRRRRGHCNDFGVSGHVRSVLRLVEATKRAWDKWLCRRSQRTRRNGERCTDL